MTEDFQTLATEDKTAAYHYIMLVIRALISAEPDLVANMSNICAVIKQQFDWHWVGFYIVRDSQLVLGPFQGPVACTRINYNKGVCGTAWALKKTIIVPDVHQFEGHIACSSLSNSEIVVPLIQNGEVSAILDIDSAGYDSFDETDARYLEEIAAMLCATDGEK